MYFAHSDQYQAIINISAAQSDKPVNQSLIMLYSKTISVSDFSSDVSGRLTIKILANVGNSDRLEVDLWLK